MGLLKCTRCKTEKPATLEFFPPHGGKNNGFDSWCRACRSTYRSETRGGNYRDAISDADLKHLISTTHECIICGAETTLVVDHDHATGKIRGMICNKCNLGIGLFQDDPDLLEFARIYLLANSDDPEHISEYEEYIESNK